MAALPILTSVLENEKQVRDAGPRSTPRGRRNLGRPRAFPASRPHARSQPVQQVMVRHEAAEAMGAIGDDSVVATLKKYSNDALPEIAETCQVGGRRVLHACAPGRAAHL